MLADTVTTLLNIEKGEERSCEKETVVLLLCGLEPARDSVMGSQTKRVFRGQVTFPSMGLSIQVSGSIFEFNIMCILRVL